MITAQVSAAEMNAFVARFRALADAGAAPDAEGRRLPLMAPPGMASHAGAPVEALPGAAVCVAEFAPGESSRPRLYRARMEHVLCFEGRFEISYGPDTHSRIVLERFDLVSVPANVLRSFRNLSDQRGRLLIVTQIDRDAADIMALDAPGDAFSESDMQARVSRAGSRVPYQKSLESQNGLPGEVMKFMAASRGAYPIVVPPNVQGRNCNAPIRGLPGASVSLIECGPGDGPQPHAHTDTREIFLCLEGRFDIVWGDRNEHVITLDPLDMVAVPATVMRLFRNVSEGIGWLMVIIQGGDDMTDAIASFPELALEVEKRFGREAVESIQRVVRQSFDAVPGSLE